METEITRKKSGGKVFFILLTIIVLVCAIYYTAMSMMSSRQKLKELKTKFEVKADKNNKAGERIFSDSAYLKLLKNKAFLQARTVMAETDSIYLTINLEDSTANIEISGVVVHKTKICSFLASNIFMKGDENTILSMLATPFTISSSNSTIRREPLMIKMAPKDTSEYKPDIMPDTSITLPVNYRLEMTDGTRIYVYQEEHKKSADKMSFFRFDLRDRLRETWNSLKKVAFFKVPDYHLYIKIWIPSDDAKIIYRALPKNGQIGVYK
jgi:hypothetical protein